MDLTGKQVVVIGSGATAATLIPSIAGQCAHVTMLQRSPTFFITGRNANELADTLRQLDIPSEWTHEIVRRKVLFDQAAFVKRCVAEPEAVRKDLLMGVRAALGPGNEALVEQHFNPRYRPWQQRIAFVPDGDLFKAVREGQASVVTDEIETFTADGIQLKGGNTLKADVVVTATGFNLNVLGDINFTVDGQPLDFANTVTWRGAMFTGVPNMAWVFGYLRASWTLRADMMGDFVCRLLKQMDDQGAQVVVPALRPQDQGMAMKPWIEPDNFNPGYMNRGVGLLPRHGTAADIIWCDVDPCYVFHVANAYDGKDGTVLVDMSVHETMFAAGPDGPNGKPLGMERWTIDLTAEKVTREALDRTPQEFHRPDERFFGQPYRYAWSMGLPYEEDVGFLGEAPIYRHDLHTGERSQHDFGPGRVPGEFVFVPRSADASEGDGWLMGYVINAAN
ncbi:MAG: hypothetical protein CFE44_23460, partial [Burkholderiales bacterium PBB4]